MWTPGIAAAGHAQTSRYRHPVIRLALLGFVVRLAVGIGIACLVALLLALIREGSSFRESLEISVWLIGCLLLLLAVTGNSPTMRMGSIDPYMASFFPELRPKMSEDYSGTRVSSGALFGLAALALFTIGVLLG